MGSKVRWSTAVGLVLVVGALLIGALRPRAEASGGSDFDGRPIATVADVANLLSYRVRTTFVKPNGTEVVRTTNGVLGVPTLVDVHGPQPATGLAGLLGQLVASVPDYSVAVVPTLTDVHLLINALPTTLNLPVQIEVIFDLPGGKGAAFGYDQRRSTAPRGVDASLAFFILDPPKGDFDFKVKQNGAPSSLTVIGELYTRGAGDARIDPKRGRLTMSPVPITTTFGLAIANEAPRAATNDPAQPITRDSVVVDVAPSSPTAAHVVATDVRGPNTLNVDANVVNLPTATSVTYTDSSFSADPAATDRVRRVDFTSSAVIHHADALVEQSVSGKVLRRIDAEVTDLPAHFTADVHEVRHAGLDRTNVDWTAGGTLTNADVVVTDLDAAGATTRQILADADAVPGEVHVLHELAGTRRIVDVNAPDAIGSIQVGLEKGGPVVLPDVRPLFEAGELAAGESPDYAVLDDDDAFVQVTGLSHARLDTADDTRDHDPLLVDVTAAAGPFLARTVDGDQDVVVRALDRPATTTITYADDHGEPRERHVTYTGSDEIDRLVATVADGLDTKEPTRLRAEVTGIPRDLSVDLLETTKDGFEQQDVTWRSGESIDRALVTLDSLDADGHLVKQVLADLSDIPEHFTLVATKDGDRRVVDFDAPDDPLGSLFAGVEHGGPVVRPDVLPLFDREDELPADAVPGFVVADGDDVAVAVTGIEHAHLDTADPERKDGPAVVDVTADEGPFVAHIVNPGDDIVVKVLDRSKTTTLVYADPEVRDGDPRFRHLEYTGSDAVERVVAVVGSDLETDEPTHLRAVALRIPESFALDLTTDDTIVDGEYHASDRIGAVDVTLDSFDTDGVAQHVVGHVRDVPTAFTFHGDFGKERTVLDFDATGGDPLGRVEAGMAKGDDPIPFVDDPSTLFRPGDLRPDQEPGYASIAGDGALAVALAEVRSAFVDTADPARPDQPLVLEVDAGAGPFGVKVVPDAETDVVARVLDRPARNTIVLTDPPVAAEGDPRFRRIEYTGSARTDAVHAVVRTDIATPEETTITADVYDVPVSFDVDVTTQGIVTDVGYEAPSSIRRIDLAVDGEEDGEDRHIEAHLDDVPLELTAHAELGTTAIIDFDVVAGPPLGRLSGGVRIGDGEVPFIDDAVALFDGLDDQFRPGHGEEPGYASLDGDDVAFSITGVTNAFVDTGEPLVVDVTAAAGPFAAHAVDPSRDVLVLVPDRPAQSRFELGAPAPAQVGNDRTKITYGGSAPIPNVFATVQAGPTRVDAAVTTIPTSFDVDIETGETGPVSTTDVVYHAVGSVAAVDVDVVTEDADGAVAKRAEAHLTQLPTDFTLGADIGEDTADVTFDVTGGAPLGSIRAGASTGADAVEFLDPRPFFDPGEVRQDAPDPAYAFLYDRTGGAKGASVSIRQVRHVHVNTANPTLVNVVAARQKLLVHQIDGSRSVEATVFDLPSTIDLSIAKRTDGGVTVNYVAAEPIDRIEAFVRDSAEDLVPPSGPGVKGIRAIDLIIEDVPTTLVITTEGSDDPGAGAGAGATARSFTGGAVTLPPGGTVVPQACEDIQVNPIICEGIDIGGSGSILDRPRGCAPGGWFSAAVCALIEQRTGGIVVSTGKDGAPIGEVQALLTTGLRDDPVPDDEIDDQIHFDDPNLAEHLAANQDGALQRLSPTGVQQLYARVRAVTRLQIDSDETDEAIFAPLDSDSFDELGSAQKRIQAVRNVPVTDRVSTVRIAAERELPATGGPTALAVRLEDEVGPDDYLILDLADAPADVGFTLTNHEKRELDSWFGHPCEVNAGDLVRDEFGTRPVYCENAMVLDYQANGAGGPLTVNTNTGDRENLYVSVPTLPETLDFCIATDAECTGFAMGVPVTGLSARFAASERVTGVTVIDCVVDDLGRGDNGECGLDGEGIDDFGRFDDTEYVTLRNIDAQFLEAEVNVPPLTGDPIGHLFINTTGRRPSDPDGVHTIDGDVSIHVPTYDLVCGPDDTRARLAMRGVEADRRYATIHIANGNNCAEPLGGITIPNRREDNPDHARRGWMDASPANRLRSEFDVARTFGLILFDPGELRTELFNPSDRPN